MENRRNIFVLGQKIGMTQVYNESGVLLPVTVVKIPEVVVVGFRSIEKDGYNAVILGFGKKRENAIKGSEAGFFGKAGLDVSKVVRELRCDDTSKYAIGEKILVTEFLAGDVVDVIGTTKGKGFQGVMKRHDFCGGPASHGSMFHRRGGSYGQRQWAGHVFRGRKMPGHDGCVGRTVQNLKIVQAIPETGLLLVSGSFPGSKDNYVTIRRAKKSM